MAELKDIMASGEIKAVATSQVLIEDNIVLKKVKSPVYEDTFVRIGQGGALSLYRAPDQDVHWEDTDVTQQVLDTAPTTMLSVTVDQELTPDDGSYTFGCILDNTANQTIDISIHVDVTPNGGSTVSSDPVLYELDRGELGRNILLSGTFDTTQAANTLYELVIDSSGAGVEMRGDLAVSKFRLTKAQAAPVTQQAGITKDVTIGNGHNAKTFHIVDGLIVSVN